MIKNKCFINGVRLRPLAFENKIYNLIHIYKRYKIKYRCKNGVYYSIIEIDKYKGVIIGEYKPICDIIEKLKRG